MTGVGVRRDKASYGQYACLAAVKSSHKVQQYNFRIVTVCFCLSTVLRSRILAKPLDKGDQMARKVRDRDLGDRASRAKLNPRGKPHWRTLDQGLHLGYRKNKDSGKWVVRVYQKGAAEPYRTHTLPGVADDRADADRRSSHFFRRKIGRANGPRSSNEPQRLRALRSARHWINTSAICRPARATSETSVGSVGICRTGWRKPIQHPLRPQICGAGATAWPSIWRPQR